VKRPTPEEVQIFATAADFRNWLEMNHARMTELWVGYYRKGVPKPSITYKEAVDEALCFGWIDGIGYRIDDESHTNRFTPRTKRSSWSAVNVQRVAELTAEGRMHPAGITAFEARTAGRQRAGEHVVGGTDTRLPPSGDLVGRIGETAGDARPPARAAHR